MRWPSTFDNHLEQLLTKTRANLPRKKSLPFVGDLLGYIVRNVAGLYGLVIVSISLALSYGSFLFSEAGAEWVAMIFAACVTLVAFCLSMLAGKGHPFAVREPLQKLRLNFGAPGIEVD